MKFQLPVIDCSKISGDCNDLRGNEDFLEFGKSLGDAMRNTGFVYLQNHNFDQNLLNQLYSKSEQFFKLPKEVKLKYRKENAVDDFLGYTPAEDEKLEEQENAVDEVRSTDYKEGFDFWGFHELKDDKIPKEIDGLKDLILESRSSLIGLSKKILLCFGYYLNPNDPEFLLKKHLALDNVSVKSQTVARMNHYFPVSSFMQKKWNKNENVQLRLGEHCDWGTFTFLFQDSVGGLECKMKDGTWIQVPPIPNTIVFNAGLMLEIWSGGHFMATAHRVRLLQDNYNKTRQSSVFFLQPDGSAMVQPIIPERVGWIPQYAFSQDENHYEFFRNRVRNTRAY